MGAEQYELVLLANGAHSVRAAARGEVFHPVIGPVAEAEALYVRQLKLRDRLLKHRGEFVVWDVGLGAAANAVTVLRACADLPCSIRMISFDQTLEPLRFALGHAAALGYFDGYEAHLKTLGDQGLVALEDGPCRVTWTLQLGDFQTLLVSGTAQSLSKPHAILFDAYSPAKNPEMWTLTLFTELFRHLDPERPCAMPTYSRSTMLRVTLLLAGFYVGAGHATGEKEETTMAANRLDLIEEPLDARWLRRARHSTSAEPLREPVYRQCPLRDETWEQLQRHRQFAG